MTKTTIKAPILQRTVLVLAMSAITFPSYALGTGDDTYTYNDEGAVIVSNSNRITVNEAYLDTLRDLQNNPPAAPTIPTGPTVPDPNTPPQSTPSGPGPGSSGSSDRTNRKCSETFDNEIRAIEYGQLGLR